MSDFFVSNKFDADEFDKHMKKWRNNVLSDCGVLNKNSELYEHFSPTTGIGYATLKDGRGVPVIARARAWVEEDFIDNPLFYLTYALRIPYVEAIACYTGLQMQEVYMQSVIAILKGIYNSSDFRNATKTDIITDINGIRDIMSDAQYSLYTAVLVPYSLADSWRLYNKRSVIFYKAPANDTSIYLLGKNFFDYADIGTVKPYEMGRNPAFKGGRGTLFVRQRKCFVPYGFSYTKANQELLYPTDEELADGSNWTLIDGINADDIPIHRVLYQV